jgi:hypothetical protein
LVTACAGARIIHIESNRPARIFDWGGDLVCDSPPCSWSVSRETCWLFDSSSGYVILRAQTPDGISMTTPAMVVCDIEEGTVVRFELPPEPDLLDCSVTIRDSEEAVFDDCADLLEP